MRTTPWQEEEDREVLSCEWLQTQVFDYYYFLLIVLVFAPSSVRDCILYKGVQILFAKSDM